MINAASLRSPSVYSVTKLDNGFAVCKNGDVVVTPAGKPLNLPTEKLAEVIAGEWRAQKEKIIPSSMPMMQFAATALDIVTKDRAAIIDQLVSYVRSELLCHYADHPDALKQLQKQKWQPVLDWCALRFDALLVTGTGIMPIEQSAPAHQALRGALESCDDFCLVGLRQAVDVSGSLILGLALLEKQMTPEQILDTAELDANFQMQQWGKDPAILDKQKSTLKELADTNLWLELLRLSRDS